MKDAIVFNGIHALDFQEIRSHVIRIPDVINKIREAQAIWDEGDHPEMDLANFIASDDSVFLSHIRLKGLATAVVQLGLYDRYSKLGRKPSFILGSYSGDSALKVIADEMSFRDLVLGCRASLQQKVTPLPTSNLGTPVLAGISLTEFAAFERSEEAYLKISTAEMDFSKLARTLVEEMSVRKFINIGPGNALMSRQTLETGFDDVQILESIDVDPMLSWFWSSLHDLKPAVAQ